MLAYKDCFWDNHNMNSAIRKAFSCDVDSRIRQILRVRNDIIHFGLRVCPDSSLSLVSQLIYSMSVLAQNYHTFYSSVGFISHLDTPFLIFDDNGEIKMCEITAPYQVLTCESVFKNPLTPHSAKKIFNSFKRYKARNGKEVFNEKFARQVSSAVYDLNKIVKEEIGHDDFMIYNDIHKPQVCLNPRYIL